VKGAQRGGAVSGGIGFKADEADRALVVDGGHEVKEAVGR
jgi:hypothetical protein